MNALTVEQAEALANAFAVRDRANELARNGYALVLCSVVLVLALGLALLSVL